MRRLSHARQPAPTVRLPAEEAVVPGEVGDDAQVVRRLADHVTRVQQRRDAQLDLCDLEGLQARKERRGGEDWRWSAGKNELEVC